MTTSRVTSSWKPPASLGPMLTLAPTEESPRSALALRATAWSAEWKQAA